MKKFNQRSFTLFAINYIVGFGFITTFTSLVKIGIFGLFVFLLTSTVTLSISLVFARLSNNLIMNMVVERISYAIYSFNRATILFSNSFGFVLFEILFLILPFLSIKNFSKFHLTFFALAVHG